MVEKQKNTRFSFYKKSIVQRIKKQFGPQNGGTQQFLVVFLVPVLV